MSRFRLFPIVLAFPLGVAVHEARAQSPRAAHAPVPARTAVSTPLAAAPYVALTPGTEYQYSTFSNRITKSQGWRSWYVDARGRPGLHVGVFINDDPAKPSKIDGRDLARLWPLRVGNTVTTLLQRADGTADEWKIAVPDTATITVPLGTVLTYHVRAVQSAKVLHRGVEPYANLYEFWYAPAWGAVARIEFIGATGRSQGRSRADQIVFIRRPKQ